MSEENKVVARRVYEVIATGSLDRRTRSTEARRDLPTVRR
jgi:hypothetical protein